MEKLWDLNHTLAGEYLGQFARPWQALAGIGAFLEEIMQNAKCKMQSDYPSVSCPDTSPKVNCRKAAREAALGRDKGRRLGCGEYRELSEGVWVHETAKVAPSAVILPPCIIGAHTEIRTGAFLRGSVLVGENCVVGNSVEIKNAILFDGVQVPHFNYVGDSILGYKAHFGAGAVTSNVRGDKGLVKIAGEDTGRKKVGAFVGDFGEIGCNAVLNPGVIIGRNAQVYPTSCVRGIVPGNSIYKNDGSIVRKNA